MNLLTLIVAAVCSGISWPLLGLDDAHKEALFRAAHNIQT